MMFPAVGNKAKFKNQFRSRLYLKIFCGLITLVLLVSLIQFIPPIAAIKDQFSTVNSSEPTEESSSGRNFVKINLIEDRHSSSTAQPEVRNAYTELFDIGKTNDQSSGRFFRIRRESKVYSLSSDPVSIRSNASSSTKNETHHGIQNREPDLKASESSVSQVDQDHSRLFNAEIDGSVTPVGAPNLDQPSLVELTAVGTAAGLLVGDLATRANELAAGQAQRPYRDTDTNSESIDRQDESEDLDDPNVMEPQASVEQVEPASTVRDQANLDHMPDSIESLMNSEMSADSEKDDSDETLQRGDSNSPEQLRLDAPRAGEPDERQVIQDSQNYQDSYPVRSAGLSPQDLALLQESSALGYNQGELAPISHGNLVVPTRDSYSDLSSAAGHHYGYKKKKKVKKIKKKKKKIVIKKKKVKKYKVKVVKYKKKKKKVKKVKKHKEHHHHGHDHGKYYMYAKVPKKKSWEFGFKKGNKKHWIERHEKGHKNKFKTKVKWFDKKSKGKGFHIWDYNHHDKKKKYHG